MVKLFITMKKVWVQRTKYLHRVTNFVLDMVVVAIFITFVVTMSLIVKQIG